MLNNTVSAFEDKLGRLYLKYYVKYHGRTTPETKLTGTAFELRRAVIKSTSCAQVLQKTLNLVILRCRFAEHRKEMHQTVYSRCRVIVFPN